MLVQAEKFLELHEGFFKVLHFGQEYNERTWCQARMNLPIHALGPKGWMKSDKTPLTGVFPQESR